MLQKKGCQTVNIMVSCQERGFVVLYLPTTPTFSGAPFFVLAAKLVKSCVRQLFPAHVAALDWSRISLETDILFLLERC